MSFSPLGDTLAVVNLAYNLYNRVIVVARDAPEQFNELSRELQVIKGVLFHIGNQVIRDSDPASNAAVRDVLLGCCETFRGLRDLIAKYENLAWSDRGVFFKRLKFASEQGAIEKFKEKFRKQQQWLQLVLTVDGRKQLNEIVRRDGESVRGLTRIETSFSEGDHEGLNEPYKSLIRAQTEATVDSATTLCNHHDTTFNPFPGTGNLRQTAFRSRTLSSTSPTSKKGIENSNLRQGGLSSIDIETSQESRRSESLTNATPNKVKKPLELPPDRQKHKVGLELQAAFKKSLESVKEDFDEESWLRLAIWWIIKSRVTYKVLAQSGLQRRRTNVSQHQDGWERSLSTEQAYTDLLKASWVLEEIVLSGSNEADLEYSSIGPLIKNLALSIDRDLGELRESISDKQALDDKVVLKQDLSLIESFSQELEAKEYVPAAMDDPLSPQRWFVPDQDNAGIYCERILFRTFVNAQLGDKTERSKSSSAPYMLLLWTTAEQNDLFVSLCNQRGTLNLCRKMVADDIEKCENADGTVPYLVDFPSQEAEVMFLSAQDVAEFLTQPRLFFAAMTDGNPRPGELMIYQAPIVAYSESRLPFHLPASSNRKMSSSKISACGLRVFESTPDKCWKTTRRLIVSSSPDSSEPECASHWLPLDHVRILVDGFKVTMSWSDCGQLRKSDEVNFRAHYSYIYIPMEPNRRIHLDFTSHAEARKFQDCLLLPIEMPPQIKTKVEISSAFQTARIYRLFDADQPDNHGYHAIALTKKNPQGPHMTEIFYAYRDLDWILKTKNNVMSVIEFPYLHTPHYTSTMPKLQYKPTPADPTPEFSNVIINHKSARLELGCDDDLISFMQELTSWRLKFFRRVAKLVLTDTGPLIGNSRHTFKDVDIQLWEKASYEGRSRIQLAVRLAEDTEDRWITTSVSDDSYNNKTHTIEINRLAVQRGVGMDTKNMTAAKPGGEEKSNQKSKWKIAITFQSANVQNDNAEFRRALGLIQSDFNFLQSWGQGMSTLSAPMIPTSVYDN